MNGASTLDCAKISRMPNSRNTKTIGISQYFFSWRRKFQNSASTRALPMRSDTSIHPRIMFRIPVAGRISRPAGAATPSAERVLSRQPPEEPKRHEEHREEDGENDPCVDVTKDVDEFPPYDARPVQEPRRDGPQHHERATHDAEQQPGLGGAPPPEESRGKHQYGADRHAKRPFAMRWTFLDHRKGWAGLES